MGGLVAAADEARAATDGTEAEKQRAAYEAVIETINKFSDVTGAAAEVQKVVQSLPRVSGACRVPRCLLCGQRRSAHLAPARRVLDALGE